ncbi:hypothetical protein DFH29DRAFT_1001492 [Suillus ampliporus]|nr:hypothetical protein DFH29DRAFT_1001492 [Suillus ampliporus]
MSDASNFVVPHGSTSIVNFDVDVIADRGYMTTDEIHYMVNSIAGAHRRVANRDDVNRSRVAARQSTTPREKRADDEDSDAYHASTTHSSSGFKTPPPLDATTQFIHAYNSLSPSSKVALRAMISADVDADASSKALIVSSSRIADSTRSTVDSIVFRDSDTKIASSIDSLYDIPRAIINLAQEKIHVPLTILTYSSIKKIHAGEDISNFPPEDTLPAVEFYQASNNFIKLMSLVAGPAIVERFKQHRSFCLPHIGERFRAILAFDIETRRMFFNTQSFLAEAAYERRWRAVELDILRLEFREVADRLRAAPEAAKFSSHSHRFHPYHNKTSDVLAESSGGNFRKGKSTTDLERGCRSGVLIRIMLGWCAAGSPESAVDDRLGEGDRVGRFTFTKGEIAQEIREIAQVAQEVRFLEWAEEDGMPLIAAGCIHFAYELKSN